MRYDPPKLVALRTTPPENPRIWEEPRFQKAETRPITHWGVSSGTGPIAAPGAYIARLMVDGVASVQPFEVLLPPNNAGSVADIQASVRLQLRVRDDIAAVSGMTNQVEYLRRQLEDARKAFTAMGGMKAMLKRIGDLDKTMLAVRDRFISRSEALSDDKFFVESYRIYLNLMWVSQVIGTGGGDTAGSADYGPTQTAIGLVDELEKQIVTATAEYKALIEKEIPAFNKAAAANGMKPLEFLK
jgi:hypothetical protein